MNAALDIDFVATPGRPMLAWVCLLAGAILLGMSADHYADLADQVSQAETQLTRLQRQSKSLVAVKGRSEQGSRQQSQKREQNLLAEAAAAGWQPVLTAVESAADKDIAILALNQEGVSRRLRISAEARNIDDALAFAERLRLSKVFGDVMLSGHENRKSTGVDVLGFTLLASW